MVRKNSNTVKTVKNKVDNENQNEKENDDKNRERNEGKQKEKSEKEEKDKSEKKEEQGDGDYGGLSVLPSTYDTTGMYNNVNARRRSLEIQKLKNAKNIPDLSTVPSADLFLVGREDGTVDLFQVFIIFMLSIYCVIILTYLMPFKSSEIKWTYNMFIIFIF